jgi:uncharacterized protein YjiS (DUF1127 family)
MGKTAKTTRPSFIAEFSLRVHSVGRAIGGWIDLWLEWAERSRQRRQLASLADEHLKDIGISRADACREADKPFWRP